MGRLGAVNLVVIVLLLMLAACAPQAAAPTAAPAATTLPLATSEPTPAPTDAPTLIPKTASTATEPTTSATTAPVGTSEAGADVVVAMKDYAFVPKDITVAAGTTVTWRNDDSAPHTVTADDKAFDSGDMGEGDEFSYTFTKAGVYPYYCIWHGAAGGEGMAGTVTVK